MYFLNVLAMQRLVLFSLRKKTLLKYSLKINVLIQTSHAELFLIQSLLKKYQCYSLIIVLYFIELEL